MHVRVYAAKHLLLYGLRHFLPIVLGDEWLHPPATVPSTYHGNGRSFRPWAADAGVS